jgi:hypothetical protein
LFINRFLKKTTVHENRKTEDNFAPESTHGILNRRQFFVFRNLQQAIEKASTKIEQKYNRIYPYEILTVSQESS